MIEKAIPIARNAVQTRIDDLSESFDFYGKFDEGVVPYSEGGHVGVYGFSNVQDCKDWCDERSDCKSFARCDDHQKCYFKNLALTGAESARNIGRCTTYYKTQKEFLTRSLGSAGCYTHNDRDTCLTLIDPREGTYFNQPCVWNPNGFTSGNKCEPKNWADLYGGSESYEDSLGISSAYVNMGKGICTDGSQRVAYCQIANIGETACRARCTQDENCSAYKMYNIWCFNSYYPQVVSKYNWNSCHNTGNAAPINGVDGVDGGICWRKAYKNDDTDRWKMWFGDRNNHLRKPYMLNVLQNMKRYLADVGYSYGFDHMANLVPRFGGGEKARMSCSGKAPCYGAEEVTWPQKIGFYVNPNSPGLLETTSVNKVAALMIHELSHSTAVALRKNLVVPQGDIDLTPTNVKPHKTGHFLAVRDWTYDPQEAKNYATCYESGQNCPGTGFSNRPAANMNMDIPLNSAANIEYWILFTKDGGSSCVSGDMLVESESMGPIKTGALVEGMKIRGGDEHGNSQWCTVQDIYFNGMGTLFGNFTEGHLIIDDSSGMVLPSGNSSHEHFGARYTIFTDCPVMENKDGELFTPLAQTFCGARDFTWSEYLVLWTAIQQVVRDTGIFWFHIDETFTNCQDETLCGNVIDWRDALPPVCESLLSCANSQDDVICDDFEEVAQNFFDRHIRAERVEEIKNAYAEYGSISQSVKDSSKNDKHLWMWVAIIAVALAGLLAILIVICRCCCQRNQVEKKQEENNCRCCCQRNQDE